MALTTESYLGLITGAVTQEIPPAGEANLVRQWLILLFRVFLKETLQDGILRCDPERGVYYYYNNRISKPTVNLPVLGIIGGYPILMGSDLEHEGTVLGGTTTSLSDGGLPGDGNDFWLRAYVLFTSGANDGLVRQVSAHGASEGSLTWETALASAPVLGDTYVVTFFYISDLTSSSTNYIFARKGSDSVSRGIMEFYASTSSTVQDGEALLASAVLDSNGDCISYNDHPEGAARDLFTGVGQYKTLSGDGSVAVPGSSEVDVTISHDQLLFCGGLTFQLTGANAASGSVILLEDHKDDEFKLTITNNTGGELTFEYAWTRGGRVLYYG